jgi:hypothetical protein
MKKVFKRQPMVISIKELRDLANKLDRQRKEMAKEFGAEIMIEDKFEVCIIQENKYDDWEFEK